jgi:hypothetical protein
MTPEEELALVHQALLLGRAVTGCCEWHDRAFRQVQTDPELLAFTPLAIRQLTIEFVVTGGIIEQVEEKRPEYNEYDFYYMVILSLPEFPHGLFVEMRLVDPDIDCPTVLLVNAHPQRK